MKQFSTRTIAIIALVAVAVLVIGVFAIQDRTQAPAPVVENGERLENQGENMENKEELVWYEIPELGVRFKVMQKMASDITYDVAKVDAVSDTHGSYTFLDVSLGSHSLDVDTKCGYPLGSIKRFEGVPTQYDGSMWRTADEEMGLGNMHQFNKYFIIGQFYHATSDGPYNCYAGTEHMSKWSLISEDLMNDFRSSIEEIK